MSREREDGRLAVFLTVLMTVGAGYTAMAFGMEWRTAAGRIGAGFFPRLVGLGIVLGAAVSLAQVLYRMRGDRRKAAADAGQSPDRSSRTFVLTVCAVVVLQAGLTVVLLPLGAVAASVLFLLATLALLNPGQHVLNAAVSVAVPVALYLLFQVALNAGLPAGVLPIR